MADPFGWIMTIGSLCGIACLLERLAVCCFGDARVQDWFERWLFDPAARLRDMARAVVSWRQR